jgi:hypothetical protein
MAALGKLVVSVGANIAEFQNGMDKAAFLAERRSADIKKALASMASTIGKGAAAAGVLLANEIRRSLNLADDIKDFSDSVGIGVEQFQKLGFAAQQNGTNMEQFRSAMVRFAGTITEDSEALKAMGIATRDAAGNIRPTGDVLLEVADKFATYQAGAEKTALATDLFGKSGSMLIPTLNEGSKGLKELGDQAAATGLVMSTSTVNGAAAVSDKIDMLQGSFRGVINDLMDGMLPALSEVGSGLLYTTERSGILKEVGAALGFVLKGLAVVIVGLAKSVTILGTALFALGKSAVAVLKGDFSGAWDAIVEGKDRAVSQFQEGVAQIQIIAGKGAAALEDQRKRAEEAAEAAAKAAAASDRAPVVPNKTKKEGKNEEEERLKRLASLLDGVAEQYREATMSADDMLMQDAKNLGATADQLDQLQQLIFAINQANAAKESALLIDEMTNKTLKEQEQLRESFDDLYYQEASAAQKYAIDLDKLIKLKQQFLALGLDEIRVAEWFDNASKRLAETLRNETAPAAVEFAQAIGTAFEDAILSGKSLSNVLKALAEDILRIIIRVKVTKPLEDAITGAISGGGGGGGLSGFFSKILGGLFGGSSGTNATGGAAAGAATSSSIPWVSSYNAGGRALGGDVMAGRTYLVGEKGPELFTPPIAGQILSNAELLNFVTRQTAKELDRVRNRDGNLARAANAAELRLKTPPEQRVRVANLSDVVAEPSRDSSRSMYALVFDAYARIQEAQKEGAKPSLPIPVPNATDAVAQQQTKMFGLIEGLFARITSRFEQNKPQPVQPVTPIQPPDLSKLISRQPGEMSARVTSLLAQLESRIGALRANAPVAPQAAPSPNRSMRQVFNINTPNADSFRLSQRQIARRARGFVSA